MKRNLRVAFTAYYDENDTEHHEVHFSRAFDRNHYPAQMVAKLDVLQDVIRDLTQYYNRALNQTWKGVKKNARGT